MSLLSAPVSYPNPDPPNPVPPVTAVSISGTCPAGLVGCTNGASNVVNLAPGTYGNITMSGQTTLHLTAGTYNVNSLVQTGNNTSIIVDSGPVNIKIQGAGF